MLEAERILAHQDFVAAKHLYHHSNNLCPFKQQHSITSRAYPWLPSMKSNPKK
jgi:hypothetical protein